jgi:hypothetical protein
MLAAGFLPLLHVLAVVAVAVVPAGAPSSSSLAAAVLVLYAAPPLAFRLIQRFWPAPIGQAPVGSAGFLAWWVAAQSQVIFNRLPALEELLRVVPSLYSFWLRLWGAHIGSLVYWAPGVRILERSLLHVGDRVVFGAEARLLAHMLSAHATGTMSLLLAPITIGDEALVGAHSMLLPGARVAAFEVMPARKTLGPFSEWRAGRRDAAARKQAE